MAPIGKETEPQICNQPCTASCRHGTSTLQYLRYIHTSPRSYRQHPKNFLLLLRSYHLRAASMPFRNELGFKPQGNYCLDYWGPRGRGEWPGPKLDDSQTNWEFPEDYPLPHRKLLNKRYWRALSRIRNEVSPIFRLH